VLLNTAGVCVISLYYNTYHSSTSSKVVEEW